MVQTSKPCRAKVFITEYSPRPTTARSKLGREEIEEPWTRNRTGSGGSLFFGELARLRKRLSGVSPFLVQYSLLQRGAVAARVVRPESKPAPAPAIKLRRDGTPHI